MISIKEKVLLIKEIIALTDTDLMYLKELDSDADYDWKYFVAYRIRAMIMKRTIEHNVRTSMFAGKEKQERYEFFIGYIQQLYQLDYLRDKLDWDSINRFDFRSLDNCRTEIIHSLGYECFVEFVELIAEFDFLNIDSQTFKNIYNDFKKEMIHLFKAGLSKALNYADLSLKNRQVAKFVNTVMINEYHDLNLKAQGKVKVKRGDILKILKVYTILGKTYIRWMIKIMLLTLKNILVMVLICHQ